MHIYRLATGGQPCLLLGSHQKLALMSFSMCLELLGRRKRLGTPFVITDEIFRARGTMYEREVCADMIVF